jgi:exodeoxyribonuclease VII large subunit
VISAVGHEVDISIADLVADVRAATPSNAAELAVPDRRALLSELLNAQRRLERAVEVYLGRARLRVARSGQRLRDPRQVLRHTRRRLKTFDLRAQARMRALLRDDRTRLAQLSAQLQRCDPRLQLAARRQRLSQLQSSLWAIGRALPLEHKQQLSQLHHELWALGRALPHPRKQQLARFAGQLLALSPLASLARGYAIVLHEPSGRALLRASDAQAGDGLQIKLHEGTLRARVETS